MSRPESRAIRAKAAPRIRFLMPRPCSNAINAHTFHIPNRPAVGLEITETYRLASGHILIQRKSCRPFGGKGSNIISDMGMTNFADNPARSRFELVEDGLTAFATYRRYGALLVIPHVEAPPALRGKGAAGRLMEGLVDACPRRRPEDRAGVQLCRSLVPAASGSSRDVVKLTARPRGSFTRKIRSASATPRSASTSRTPRHSRGWPRSRRRRAGRCVDIMLSAVFDSASRIAMSSRWPNSSTMFCELI